MKEQWLCLAVPSYVLVYVSIYLHIADSMFLNQASFKDEVFIHGCGKLLKMAMYNLRALADMMDSMLLLFEED